MSTSFALRLSLNIFLLFLFVCSSNGLMAQVYPVENKRKMIEWSEQMFIQLSDYTPRTMPKNRYLPMSSTFEIDVKTPFLKLFGDKNYNENVVCYFDPNTSWVNMKEATGEDLKFQITMFLIYEISARQIRKSLYESNRFKVLFGSARKIYNDEMKILRNTITKYSETSQMGLIKLQQQRWERELRNELESLSSFCSYCKIREIEEVSGFEIMLSNLSVRPKKKEKKEDQDKKEDVVLKEEVPEELSVEPAE